MFKKRMKIVVLHFTHNNDGLLAARFQSLLESLIRPFGAYAIARKANVEEKSYDVEIECSEDVLFDAARKRAQWLISKRGLGFAVKCP